MMEEGIVYILTNRAMPDYIKIGFTSRADIKARLKELYSTGVPFPFELYYAAKVSSHQNIEKKLHQIFSVHRENSDREFFKMDPERAMLALSLTAGQEIKLEDSEVYSQEDEVLIEKTRKAPKPAFSFSMVGLQPGDILTYTRDENITCTIISDNRVSYNEKEYSLTSLARELLGSYWNVRGPLHWMHNGKILTELRSEKEMNEIQE